MRTNRGKLYTSNTTSKHCAIASRVYKTIFSSALTAESQKLQQLAAQPKSGNSINTGERLLQELDALQSYQAKLNQCQTILADATAALELLEFQAD